MKNIKQPSILSTEVIEQPTAFATSALQFAHQLHQLKNRGKKPNKLWQAKHC
jgi:hypothetical protein